jgi:hypothetical protein
MSKLLHLCILVAVCVACAPEPSRAPEVTQAATQEGQQPIAAQNQGHTTLLLADLPAATLVPTSQAASGPIRNDEMAGNGPTLFPEAVPVAGAGDLSSEVGQPVHPADATGRSLAGLEDGREQARLEALDTLQLLGCTYNFLSHWSVSELRDLIQWLHRGIWFEGDWTSQGLRTAMQGLQWTASAFDGDWSEMEALLGISASDPLVYRVCRACYDGSNHFSLPWEHQVTFDSNPDQTSFLHETGHVVDHFLTRSLETGTVWWSEAGLLGSGWREQVHPSGEAGPYYLDSEHDAPFSEHSPSEDFADTFAAWVLAQNGQPLPRGWRPPSERRMIVLATTLRSFAR